MIRKLTIGSKLAIGFGILVLLVFVVVGLSYVASSNATRKIDTTDRELVPTALASAEALANLLRMLGDARGYLALGDPEFQASYGQSRDAFAANLIELQQLSPNFDEQNRQRLEQLQVVFKQWDELTPRMFELRDDKLEREPAYKLLAIEGSRLAGRVLIDTDRLIETQVQLEPSRSSVDLLQDMHDFQATVASMFSALRGYVTTSNRIYKQEYEFNLSANDLAWRRLQSKRDRLTSNQQSILNEIGTRRSEFLDTIPEALFTTLEGDRAREDLFIFTEQAIPLASEMEELLGLITVHQQQQLQADLRDGKNALFSANQRNLGSGVVALVLGVLMAIFITRSITRPIRRLTNVAEQIRGGDLSVQATVDSQDEIGILAATFNKMTSRLSQTLHQVSAEKRRADDLLEVVIPLGVALSAEKDYNRLLATIVSEAKAFCSASVGRLYLRTADDHLRLVTVFDDTQPDAAGAASADQTAPIPLCDPLTGAPNARNIAVSASLNDRSINIASLEQAADFDFAWPPAGEPDTSPPSLLSIPLKTSLGQSVGVLELSTARDPETGQIIVFDQNLQQLMESFSSLASAALGVYIREQSLRQEIHQLRIEIDQAKRQQQVSEIVDTDFFQNIRSKARAIRSRGSSSGEAPRTPETAADAEPPPGSNDTVVG
jgi:CHASE3 domain sensor protein